MDGRNASLSRLYRIFLPPGVGLLLYLLFSADQTAAWLTPSLAHPLGTDEFGRDILATLLGSAGLSMVKGAVVTIPCMITAIVFAELITLRSLPAIAHLVRWSPGVVESVPVVLWVVIVLIVMQEPRLLVTASAFALAVLPSAVHILSGEFLRLRQELYVEAAYLLGVGEPRVLMRYLLPNATAVLLPFSLQVLGAAIAVDGAIGVIGLGSRADLDLGVFLLRGKESFLLHPQLLLAALATYAGLYAYLIWIGSLVRAFTLGPDNQIAEPEGYRV
jgi:peptide/nickel transport system permease protein